MTTKHNAPTYVTLLCKRKKSTFTNYLKITKIGPSLILILNSWPLLNNPRWRKLETEMVQKRQYIATRVIVSYLN